METVKKYLKSYFIDAMGAMALGLFASLLIGTIFGTVYKYTELELLNTIATYAKAATGMAIGVAIAHRLGAHPRLFAGRGPEDRERRGHPGGCARRPRAACHAGRRGRSPVQGAWGRRRGENPRVCRKRWRIFRHVLRHVQRA